MGVRYLYLPSLNLLKPHHFSAILILSIPKYMKCLYFSSLPFLNPFIVPINKQIVQDDEDEA